MCLLVPGPLNELSENDDIAPVVFPGNRTSSWSGRIYAASLIAVVSFGLFGLGVLLSSTYGASQVADNARRLHWTNAALGATGIARAAVAQAVIFSYDNVSDAEGTRQAIAEARVNLDGVASLLASPDAPGDEASRAIILGFVEAASATVDKAAEGDPAEAEVHRIETLEPAYSKLRAELEERQQELASMIAESERVGGRISRITFVAISFLIPALTMIAFWLIFRGRIRNREDEMRVRLEAERDLNRAKDEFIAGLSHELRTPLTSIVGFSEMLMDDPSMKDEAREQLRLIHESSSDLTRMVGDLLTAARLDADALTVAPQVVDLAEEVEAATRTYRMTGESIETKVPSIDVYADPLLVRQIAHNLVSNALRHGGDHVLVTASRKGGSAYLVVADDGPGVPTHLEAGLFKRFIHEGRQALTAGSVGLGLAISHELASRMGGTLRYGRAHGWTAFTLKLRAVPETGSGAKTMVAAGTGDM